MPSRAQIIQSDPSIRRRYNLADALGSQAMSTSPIQHPLQGVAQLVQALASNRQNERANAEITERQGAAQSNLAQAMAALKSGDYQGAASIFSRNPDNSAMGVQLALQQASPAAQAAAAAQKSHEARYGPGSGQGAPVAPQGPRGPQYAMAGQQATPGGPTNLVPPAMQAQAAQLAAPQPAAAQPQAQPTSFQQIMAETAADPNIREMAFSMEPGKANKFVYDEAVRRAKAQREANKKPTPPQIAQLHAYRASLPQGDPRRAEVDAQIQRLGQAPSTTIQNMGSVPPGYERFEDPKTGAVQMRPIPGSPADLEQKSAAEAAASQSGAQLQADVAKAETMLDAVSGIRAEFEGANTPVTGTGSGIFAQFSGSPAGRVKSYVDTLQSGTVLGTMQELKKASSSGATGFGALNEKELGLMISAIGALDPATTDPDIFLKTIDRIDNQYNRVIQDIQKNVSPERIKELGLEGLLASAKVSRETGGNYDAMSLAELGNVDSSDLTIDQKKALIAALKAKRGSQ